MHTYSLLFQELVNPPVLRIFNLVASLQVDIGIESEWTVTKVVNEHHRQVIDYSLQCPTCKNYHVFIYLV